MEPGGDLLGDQSQEAPEARSLPDIIGCMSQCLPAPPFLSFQIQHLDCVFVSVAPWSPHWCHLFLPKGVPEKTMLLKKKGD